VGRHQVDTAQWRDRTLTPARQQPPFSAAPGDGDGARRPGTQAGAAPLGLRRGARICACSCTVGDVLRAAFSVAVNQGTRGSDGLRTARLCTSRTRYGWDEEYGINVRERHLHITDRLRASAYSSAALVFLCASAGDRGSRGSQGPRYRAFSWPCLVRLAARRLLCPPTESSRTPRRSGPRRCVDAAGLRAKSGLMPGPWARC